MTCGKSGLFYSALAMLIFVLSNKAEYLHQIITRCCAFAASNRTMPSYLSVIKTFTYELRYYSLIVGSFKTQTSLRCCVGII